MTERSNGSQRIRVQDRRRAHEASGGDPSQGPADPEVREATEAPEREEGAAPEARETAAAEAAPEGEERHDYLDDLRRLQAEFENFRKQNLKRQTEVVEMANVRLVEKLLPALDNLERAVEHGEGGPGVQLVFKELRGVLESEGLREIESLGVPFDPNVHEPVEVRHEEDVHVTTVVEVYRTGYRFKNRVLRPAMVVVAHPAGEAEGSDAVEG